MSRLPEAAASAVTGAPVELHDLLPPVLDVRRAVLDGLSADPKRLPCGLLYDERGSALFEAITRLPEYYPTRAERAILAARAGEIAELCGPRATLVEYGCGACAKVRLLLARQPEAATFVGIDISAGMLREALGGLARGFPGLRLVGVCADYEKPLPLRLPEGRGRRVALFLGSTIGNLDPDDASAFLGRMVEPLRPGDGALIGVDLKKDPGILHAAYNDAAGTTAAFNLNVLRHVNARCEGDFDLRRFAHRAFYNEALGRVEMHLASLCDQSARVAGTRVELRRGETIHTENSYKYDVDEFHRLAARAGLSPVRVWFDPARLFSLHFLEVG